MNGRIVWSSPWFSIEEIEINARRENGHRNEPYYRIQTKDTVAILPVTRNRKFVFVKQFRPALGRCVIEVPAGGIDEGERPEIAEVRELVEEAGNRSEESLLPLARGSSSTGRFSNTNYWFVALNVEPMPNWNAEEGIQPIIISPSELKEMYGKDFIDGLINVAIITLAKKKFGENIPTVW